MYEKFHHQCESFVQKQCAEKHQRRLVQPETRSPPNDSVPCEFCHESFPTNEIERHSVI